MMEMILWTLVSVFSVLSLMTALEVGLLRVRMREHGRELVDMARLTNKSADHIVSIWHLLTSTPSDDNADGDLNTFVVGDMVEHASGVGEVVEVDVFGCTVSFSCESTPRWVPHQELSHLMVGYRIIGGPPEVPEA